MTEQQKNSALVVAIVAGLLSLPLTWLTIRGAQMGSGLPSLFGNLGGMSINITGLNGHITVFVKSPIWFIVFVAISASVLQLMRNSNQFAVPIFAQSITAVIATIWIGVALIVGLSSGNATLGIGALLGFASAVIPVICLLMTPGNRVGSETM